MHKVHHAKYLIELKQISGLLKPFEMTLIKIEQLNCTKVVRELLNLTNCLPLLELLKQLHCLVVVSKYARDLCEMIRREQNTGKYNLFSSMWVFMELSYQTLKFQLQNIFSKFKVKHMRNGFKEN